MTRGELKERLSRWAKRSDVSSLPVDDWIDDAYAVIVREVNPIDLDVWKFLEEEGTEVRAQIYSYPLPEDCIDVFHVSNNNDRLRSLRSDALLHHYGNDSGRTSFCPSYYAVVGRSLWIGNGAVGDLMLGYLSRDAEIPNDDDENFGLKNYPHCYFELAMAGLHNYAENTEEEEKARARYVSYRNQINEVAGAVRMGGGGRIANW